MIRSLRAWHRRWMALLAVLLPLLIFLALRSRPTSPVVDAHVAAPAGGEDDGR